MLYNTNDTIVIVDTRAFQYEVSKQIVNSYKKNTTIPKKAVEQHTNNALIYLLSGVWIEQIYPNTIKFLFVCDTKPYWRHYELYKIGVNYKGNRFRNPLYDEVLTFISTYTESFLHKNSINILQQGDFNKEGVLIGYEADDIAALAVKELSPHCKHLYTLTCDNDWLPFTSLGNVTWLGMPTVGFKNKLNQWETATRVRDCAGALDWFQTSSACNNTYKKRAFIKDDITALWKFKAEFGDTSDNIRGNIKDQSPGKYDQYIDLWAPPEQYRLDEKMIVRPYITKGFTPCTLETFNELKIMYPFTPFTPQNAYTPVLTAV